MNVFFFLQSELRYQAGRGRGPRGGGAGDRDRGAKSAVENGDGDKQKR